MYSNPFVTQLLAEERVKDAMRRNEQARLIRAVEGSGKSWRWRLPMILARQNVLLPVYVRNVNNVESIR